MIGSGGRGREDQQPVHAFQLLWLRLQIQSAYRVRVKKLLMDSKFKEAVDEVFNSV